MTRRILFVIIALILSTVGVLAQSTSEQLVIRDNPTITITTATADTTPTTTSGIHQATVVWTFGTVVGSYSGCTVQAKTTIDGAPYLTLGSAKSVTVTSGAVNSWTITEPVATTVSSTAAQSFGSYSKFTFACSSYGTSAPVIVAVLYTPTTTASGGGGGGGGDASAANQTAVQGTLDGTFPSKAVAIGGADSQTDLMEGFTNYNGGLAVQPLYAGLPATTGAGHVESAAVPVVTIATDSGGQIKLATGSAQIGHLEANQSANVAQINGVAPSMGNGASGTGVQRVTIANDSTGTIAAVTAITNALPAGTNVIGALSANQTVDVNKIGGGAVATVGTGVQKVAIVDSNGNAITNADVVPTNTTQWGSVSVPAAATSGMPVTAPAQVFTPTEAAPYPSRTVGQYVNQIVSTDGPTFVTQSDCGNQGMVSSVVLSTSGIGQTQAVSLTSGEQILVCGWNVMSAGTTNFNLSYGTGIQCGTGNAALTGAYPLIAQVGMVVPNAGSIQTKAAVSNALCYNNSAAVGIFGMITYVKRKL